MPTNVKPIPDGYHSVTPNLIVRGAAQAIEFYKKAFGAVELMRMPGPGNKITHAEIKIGDSIVFVNDEFPEMPGTCRSPQTLKGVTASLFVYVMDVDVSFTRAVNAGAKP